MMIRAVIFDLGGVVFPSPFDAFDAYERSAGLPHRFIRTVVAASAETGAWARLERSEVDFEQFCTELESECASAGGIIDAAALMRAITSDFSPRTEMVRAIRAIQDHGLRVGALTNNWAVADPATNERRVNGGEFAIRFDTVVESALEGIRKPDPAIYHLVCDRLAVTPTECAFLDDLGINLKPARAMGMTTIKVTDSHAALDELAVHLGFALGSR